MKSSLSSAVAAVAIFALSCTAPVSPTSTKTSGILTRVTLESGRGATVGTDTAVKSVSIDILDVDGTLEGSGLLANSGGHWAGDITVDALGPATVVASARDEAGAILYSGRTDVTIGASGNRATVTVAKNAVPLLTLLNPVMMFPESASRVVTAAPMTKTEYNVAMGCPGLRGFAVGKTGLTEGDTLTESYLGTDVTFTVTAFTGGAADRVVSGVRYSGTSADGSVVLTIDLDPLTKDFYYDQRLFLDDSLGITNSPMKAYLYFHMKGTLSDRNGFLCHPQGIALMHFTSGAGSTMVFAYKNMEYFSGPWGNGTGGQGTGLVIDMDTLVNGFYAGLPTTSGGTARPDENPTAGSLGAATDYLASYLEGFTPGTYQKSLLMTLEDGQPAFFSQFNGNKWPDGLADPVTRADAKDRLPADAWKALSTLGS